MSTVTLTHIGGPTTLIEAEGWRILTDPTFDAPGRTYSFGWGSSSRKTTGPAAAVDELGRLDAVLLSHDHHADNLDDTGRDLLTRIDPILTTTSGAARLGHAARGLRAWDTSTLEAPGRPTITVTATPCRHGPAGSHPIVGDVIGFALGWPGQQHGELWISGDTVLYRRVRDVGRRINVGTAILHLGAVRFRITGPVAYTMNARDAIELGRTLQPTTTFPVHYEGWSHFHEGRTEIERTFRDPSAHSLGEVVWPTSGRPQHITV
jgi:L-ascorbate metabolism protein UlaG (beta-lactamase superfamily)